MKRYIDADKLLDIIIKMQKEYATQEVTEDHKELIDYKGLITVLCGQCLVFADIIKSLQQEQPEVDLVAELEHHLATTPKEQLEKEWKELEPWGNIGPTVQEFLYGKQPEVDLEKEIDNWYNTMDIPVTADALKETARHFAEWGATHLNARKEK